MFHSFQQDSETDELETKESQRSPLIDIDSRIDDDDDDIEQMLSMDRAHESNINPILLIEETSNGQVNTESISTSDGNNVKAKTSVSIESIYCFQRLFPYLQLHCLRVGSFRRQLECFIRFGRLFERKQ